VGSGGARDWGLESDGYVARAAVVGDREREREGFGGIGNGSFDGKERAQTGKRRKRTTGIWRAKESKAGEKCCFTKRKRW
jgi:hypothetical protein